MVKAASSAMLAHLALECTTLATCWDLKRRDGKFFRFTDNVKNLTVDSNTYRSDTGYTRSALVTKADMSVDNMEVEGFYQVDAISETDLRAGLFDFAEIRIFLVNHQDTTQTVKLRRGYIGEVQTLSSEQFKAELRSLSQRLTQNIGVLSQPTCRAQLGDPRQCRFPIQPPVVLRSTTYSVGDFVRVYTDTASQVLLTVPLLDGDFEALTNWTTISGDPELIASRNGLSAFEGSTFVNGDTTASPDGFVLRQDVDITGIGGFSQSDLDNGFYLFNASVRQAQTATTNRDAGRVRVEALDTTGEVLQELWNTKFEVLEKGIWELFTVSDVVLPAGTVTLRYSVEAGSYDILGVTEVGFDDLRTGIIDNGSKDGSQRFYENRMYECTTNGTTAVSQPVYDTVVDNTTTDGTAVFTSREAFMRGGVVATVTDRRQFTITITAHPDSVDDYLNGGALTWETGANAGLSMEIKDWDQSSSAVTLFLEMPNTVAVADRFRFFPGCDKLRATCRGKFVVPNSLDFTGGNMFNFDGEPDIPGPDAVLTYPDAE